MRLKEQRLWDRMRNNLPSEVYAERIENMLAAGFPDILLKAAAARAPVFCETKAVDALPVRTLTTRVFGDRGLSQEQLNWHLLWARHGGLSVVVGSCGAGAATLHWAIPGRRADEFNGMTAAALSAASVVRARIGADFWAGFAVYLRGA